MLLECGWLSLSFCLDLTIPRPVTQRASYLFCEAAEQVSKTLEHVSTHDCTDVRGRERALAVTTGRSSETVGHNRPFEANMVRSAVFRFATLSISKLDQNSRSESDAWLAQASSLA